MLTLLASAGDVTYVGDEESTEMLLVASGARMATTFSALTWPRCIATWAPRSRWVTAAEDSSLPAVAHQHRSESDQWRS
ncbi:MAG: hypothetical protein IPN53_24050 [Comamonadaceae bacterium]|nr:hypothetical protein [Comamonadaceae bacterium]